jgi:hypothetical protein
MPNYGLPMPNYGLPMPNYGSRMPNYGSRMPNYGLPMPALGNASPRYNPRNPRFRARDTSYGTSSAMEPNLRGQAALILPRAVKKSLPNQCWEGFLSAYPLMSLWADIIRRVAMYPPFSSSRISAAYLRVAAVRTEKPRSGFLLLISRYRSIRPHRP